MTDKPRIGRPKGDGTYKMIGVYGTQHEIDAVLELTPRQRMEAMLEALEANSADPDWMPPPVYACTCGRGAEVHPMHHALDCEMYVPF
jgi:hypothetical protein